MSETADILLTNCSVINVQSRSVEQKNVGIQSGCFLCDAQHGKIEIDMRGNYIAPGFIDAHMHVESTMLIPSSFANVTVPHGTTTVILDPHEIANVLGISGIELLLNDATNLPIDCFFMASSCVPASPLETSGAQLTASDLEPLFLEQKVIGLAEMMNYPGVINRDREVMEKIELGLKYGKVDGHCPGLRGDALQQYIDAGISSDHESTTAEEAQEKLDRGMQIYIREGSAAQNLRALIPIITEANAHQICFCTDDRHPADLQKDGHIDHVVRKAISLGLDPLLAISIATKHAADHFGLSDLGSIETGMKANFIVFDDLRNIQPNSVWHGGEKIAEHGQMLTPIQSKVEWYSAMNTVRLPKPFSPTSFEVHCDSKIARVIVIIPQQLVTEELHLPVSFDQGFAVANTTLDMLKLAVIERHHQTGNIGLGFVKGFQFQNGAIASTVGHDAHNLAVVGDNDADMHLAAVTLEQCGGGQCVVSQGTVLATLQLDIAGLMSSKSPKEVIEAQHAVLAAAHLLGCGLDDPFMPLSFFTALCYSKVKTH